MSALAEGSDLPARARNTLAALVGDFARWREQSETLSPAELLRLVVEESGYTAMLQADRSPESAGRLENLSELARAMEE